MEDKEVIYKEMLNDILKAMIEGENKRNELFEKSLYIFLSTVIGVTVCYSITLWVLFTNMFVR